MNANYLGDATLQVFRAVFNLVIHCMRLSYVLCLRAICFAAAKPPLDQAVATGYPCMAQQRPNKKDAGQIYSRLPMPSAQGETGTASSATSSWGDDTISQEACIAKLLVLPLPEIDDDAAVGAWQGSWV